jgi:hypothetical protein
MRLVSRPAQRLLTAVAHCCSGPSRPTNHPKYPSPRRQCSRSRRAAYKNMADCHHKAALNALVHTCTLPRLLICCSTLSAVRPSGRNLRSQKGLVTNTTRHDNLVGRCHAWLIILLCLYCSLCIANTYGPGLSRCNIWSKPTWIRFAQLALLRNVRFRSNADSTGDSKPSSLQISMPSKVFPLFQSSTRYSLHGAGFSKTLSGLWLSRQSLLVPTACLNLRSLTRVSNRSHTDGCRTPLRLSNSNHFQLR